MHCAQEFPGQPQLVKDILLRLKGSLCHKDLFLVVPSARTLEKISLMRKVGPSWAHPRTHARCNFCACAGPPRATLLSVTRCRPGTRGRARCGWRECRTLTRCVLPRPC